MSPATGFAELGQDVWHDIDGTGYIALDLTEAIEEPQPSTVDGVALEPTRERHCSLLDVRRYAVDRKDQVAIGEAVKRYLREHDLSYVDLGKERYLCRKGDRTTVVAPVRIEGLQEFVAFLRAQPRLHGYSIPFPHVTLLKSLGSEFGIAIRSMDDLGRYCEKLPDIAARED